MSALFGRRLLAVLAVAVAISFSPAPAAAVQAPSSAEAYLMKLVNNARTDKGLRPLYWDSRLADVAQSRSNDMAAGNWFGHLSFNSLASKVDAKNISWFKLGENIARNNYSTATDSARATMSGWRDSSAHWALLTSSDYNYAAIGLRRSSSGWYYWTMLLIKGPDRTAPVAKMGGASLGSLSGGYRTTNVSWSGQDVRLQVLTSGLRDFKLQRRIGSGSWRTVTSWTSSTTKKFSLRSGKTYRFRVKARDNKGNTSRWSSAIVVRP